MTLDQTRIASALERLIAWLESWRDDNGAYNGFVVHRTEAKRMGRVHDTAWTQAAVIRGYSNLYRKSREQRWYDRMVLAADLLASRYDPQTGRIQYTGHEDDRFQSLVSCALAICALLSIADLVDEKRRNTYIQLSADHARQYWLDVLWVEQEGAFKFNEIDYYNPNEDRFVINFNTMAAEALLLLFNVTGDDEFRNRALQIGNWLLSKWEDTCKVNDQLLAGKVTVADDPNSEWMPPGGFSYQFTESQPGPDNYVTIYTGLSLRGLFALYRATDDESFAKIIRAQSNYLHWMRDPTTKLFYHTARSGKIEKNPQFIAGAGMTLVGLHEVQTLVGDRAVPEDTIESILDRQYPNGAYPNFLGMNDKGTARRCGGGVVWEDAAATMNWNAQFFEYLTRLVETPSVIEDRNCRCTVRVANRRFFYRDSLTSVAIVSWWPLRSCGIYFYAKRRPKAVVAIYPVQMFQRLRSYFRTKHKTR